MAYQLQYQSGVGLLKHDGFTNPAQSGKMMGECCCDDTVCQWAIDWIYVCIGRCASGIWTDDGAASGINADAHNPGIWTASTAYTVPGTLVMVSGVKYGLKIRHTSGSSFDATEAAYWVSVSGWIAYDNGLGGVTPANYPDSCAYTVTTDGAHSIPAPGIHCAGDPGNVGKDADLLGCSAARYGTIHQGECPASPDVSMDAPTECEHDVMCGCCFKCGPKTPACYDGTFDPGVLPCGLILTYHIDLVDYGIVLDGNHVVNIYDCNSSISYPYQTIWYYFNPGLPYPVCPGGLPVLRTVTVSWYPGSSAWVVGLTFYICDGAVQKRVQVYGAILTYVCEPVGNVVDIYCADPFDITGSTIVITSNSP